MDKSAVALAQRIADFARAHQHQRTGYAPEAVTLVIIWHGTLPPVEQDLCRTARGAAQVRQFHQQVIASSTERLWQAIETTTGIAVRAARFSAAHEKRRGTGKRFGQLV